MRSFVPPRPDGDRAVPGRPHPFLLVLFGAVILRTLWTTMQKSRDRRLAVWAFAWMGITILPVMMLTLGEHFLYLPSVGYCILVAAQLPADPTAVGAKERRSLAIVGALVVLVCIVRPGLFAEPVVRVDVARDRRRRDRARSKPAGRPAPGRRPPRGSGPRVPAGRSPRAARSRGRHLWVLSNFFPGMMADPADHSLAQLHPGPTSSRCTAPRATSTRIWSAPSRGRPFPFTPVSASSARVTR